MSFAQLHAARRSRQAQSYVEISDAQGSEAEEMSPAPPSSGDSVAVVETQDASADVDPRPQDQHSSAPSLPADTTSISHDGLYACIPPYLEIRSNTKSGRGVYAKQAIVPGSIIISTLPHVHVLSTPFLSSHCSACAGTRPGGGMKRCTECRLVHYCDTTCQTSDWRSHKDECAALRRAADSCPGEAVRCLGRLVWARKRKGAASAWVREVDAMASHKAALNKPAPSPSSITAPSPSTSSTSPESSSTSPGSSLTSSDAALASLSAHTALAHALVRYLGARGPAELAELGIDGAGALVDLVSRFTTNTLTLSSPTLAPLGLAVSPAVALVNHACAPNAVVVFPRAGQTAKSGGGRGEPAMQVVALRAISPGEEVTTAYIDTTVPRMERRKVLRETYHFECACQLCEEEEQHGVVGAREAVLCRREGCGGVGRVPDEGEDSTSMRCVKCKGAFAAEHVEALVDGVRLGREALEKATALRDAQPAHALRLARGMLPILTGHGLAPGAHPRLALARLYLELLIDTLGLQQQDGGTTLEELDEMVRAAGQVCEGLEGVLAYGHPVRAVARAETGKLLAVDEPAAGGGGENENGVPHGPARLGLAYNVLRRALEEAEVGFGRANGGGALGRELREMVVRLEREVEVWRRGVKVVDPIAKATQQ